ncbi:DUF6876 family protein [Paraburkholderia tropica]|uniref:DUF6876 family protein n=1 Tax=Paraburkholderia tropica TaxID=92647 RepID=UPI0007EDD1C0|nr:DUF6876 family protein [Paraburkholderia tropica]OBR53721.1 hypothetical protein A6456_12370 [Paraburkholderia tropica]
MSQTDTLDAQTLAMFTGSENYYNQGPVLKHAIVTDGVHYLMTHGMAWLVTDALTVVVTRAQHDGFWSITFTPHADGSGSLVITDGNDLEIYRQRYLRHDYPLPKPLRLFAVFTDIERPRWLAMLASEY